MPSCAMSVSQVPNILRDRMIILPLLVYYENIEIKNSSFLLMLRPPFSLLLVFAIAELWLFDDFFILVSFFRFFSDIHSSFLAFYHNLGM